MYIVQIQINMSEVLTSLTDLFSFWDLSVTYTHTHCYNLQEERDTREKRKRKQAFGRRRFFVLKKNSQLVLFPEALEHL